MSYETMIAQIKSVPQECLDDVANYIQFILYRHNQNVKEKRGKNLAKYFGSVKFTRDALAVQKEMRNEWN